MTSTNPQRFNSHESRGNVSQTVTRFVDAVEDLAVELDAPDGVVSEFVDAGRDMAKLVEKTAQGVESNAEQIEDNEEEIENEIERRSAEIEGCHNRISNVEGSNSEDETPTPEVGETALQEPETPLEDIVQLPEHVVDESLSANQRRSRFVAKDVNQYSRSVPAGRAIKSSELRRVLSARDDGSCHTQTVQRVMNRLDDLGGDDVAIKETQEGEKVIVFTDEIVRRIQRYNDNHGVVAYQEVST